MVPLPIPVLDSCMGECGLEEKQHHIMDADSGHIWPSGEPCPSPARYCCLTGTIAVSSNGTAISQLLQGGGNMAKSVNSTSMSPPISSCLSAFDLGYQFVVVVLFSAFRLKLKYQLFPETVRLWTRTYYQFFWASNFPNADLGICQPWLI